MMMNDKLIRFLTTLLICSISCSCQDYDMHTDDRVISFELGCGGFWGGSEDAKSSLGTDCNEIEGKISSYTVGVYDSSSGLLICGYSGDPSSVTRPPSVTLSVPSGCGPVTVYAFLNMFKTVDGSVRPIDVPASKSAAESLKYSIPYFSILQRGLPAAGKLELASFGESTSFIVTCTRLVAKVNVTIDSEGLDGGISSLFSQLGLYLRQANSSLCAFGISSAASNEDILPESDYENRMGGSGSTYTIYVPANSQGENGSVTSPSSKVPGNAPSGKSGLVSYLEFIGKVNAASYNGIEGDVCYRFCLGSNNTDDFNVLANTVYNIRMRFDVNSLFSGPVWKIESDVRDSRQFSVFKNSDCKADATLSCSKGEYVVVRPSRPGTVYMYMNPDGKSGDENYLGEMIDCASIRAADLSDRRWALDASAMKTECGICPSYDIRSHRLVLSVVDINKFNEVLNTTRTYWCTLALGSVQLPICMKMMEDISVSSDKSLTEGFYVAMRRTLKLKGIDGNLSVFNDSGKPESGIRAEVSSHSRPDRTVGISACHEDNDNYGSSLSIIPEDQFNNDIVHIDAKVCRPEITVRSDDSIMFIRGDDSPVHVRYCRTADGKSVIPFEDFDRDLYAALLSPTHEGCTELSSSGSMFSSSDLGYDFGGEDEYGYPVLKATVRNIPATYDPEKNGYATVRCSAAYDSANNDMLELTILRFNVGRDSSAPTMVLDDYTMIDASYRSTLFPDSFEYTSAAFVYGVKNDSDLGVEVVKNNNKSYDNDCISAKMESASFRSTEGKIKFHIKDSDLSDINISHSIGGHDVRVYTENIHNGSRASVKYSMTAVVHVAVGAMAYLGNYNYGYNGTSCTARLYPYITPNLAKTALYGTLSDEIKVKFDGSVYGPGYPYSTVRKSSVSTVARAFNGKSAVPFVEFTYSATGSDSKLMAMYNDRSGKDFWGAANYSPEFYSKTPAMVLTDRTGISSYKSMTISVGDISNAYVVDLLETVGDTRCRGWMNIALYGTENAMQYYEK